MSRFIGKLNAAFVATNAHNMEEAKQHLADAFNLEELKAKGLDAGVFTLQIEEHEDVSQATVQPVTGMRIVQ
jgi:tyrosine-protein phosphatase YwqE